VIDDVIDAISVAQIDDQRLDIFKPARLFNPSKKRLEIQCHPWRSSPSPLRPVRRQSRPRRCASFFQFCGQLRESVQLSKGSKIGENVDDPALSHVVTR
jgi:hypothetical protein